MAKAIPTTFKILHTADWHVSSEFIFDARECLDFLVKYVQSHEVPLDLIVIPGDIYNHRQIQQETESARLAFSTIRVLAKFAPVIILTGTPSHDGNAPLMLDDIGDRFPVLVVDHPSQWAFYGGGAVPYAFYPIKHVQPTDAKAIISCTPAFTKQHFESGSDITTSDAEIASSLGAIFAKFGADYRTFAKEGNQVPHILLGHYSIGGAYIHPAQPMIGKDIEISTTHLAMAEPTIVCMGHIHTAQQVAGAENIFYSGSLFANNFGEVETKGFYVHALRPADYGHDWEIHDCQFIETPSPKLQKFEIDLINNPPKNEDFALWERVDPPPSDWDWKLQYILMHAKDVPEETENCIVRMEIKCYQDEAALIDQDAIYEYFDEMNLREFKLTLTRIPRANVRSAKIMDADRLADKLKYRAEIIDDELPEDVEIRADLLQDQEPEKLIKSVMKSINERRSNDPSNS